MPATYTDMYNLTRLAEWLEAHDHMPNAAQFARSLRAVIAGLIEETTPPPPEQPEPSSPWKCRICGKPVRISDDLQPRHLAGPTLPDHAAELSDDDLKTLADGLRLTD
jgi:hypothetical protein